MKQTIFVAIGLLVLVGCGPDTLIIRNETRLGVVGVSINMTGPSYIENNTNAIAARIEPGESRGMPWPLTGWANIRIYLDEQGTFLGDRMPMYVDEFYQSDFVRLYTDVLFAEGTAVEIAVVDEGEDYALTVAYEDIEKAVFR